MSQQYPFGSPNDNYRKKLFVDNGMEFVEVKARIIEPYNSPSPQPQTREVKIINAPSHLHQMGVPSYKATLNLLFYSKKDYVEYVTYSGWAHKLYDELGGIYVGGVETIKAEPYEGNKKYKVEIQLILIRKDSYDHRYKSLDQFQDVNYLTRNSPNNDWYAQDLFELATLGIVTTYNRYGDPVLYFRPLDYCTRAEFIAMLMRTKRLLEQLIRE